tara:strand:- start:22076 stop:22288 length:213 start_codon:yes stop_codon:yes gene_type:complete
MYEQISELAKFAEKKNKEIHDMLNNMLEKIARNKSRKIYLSIDPEEMEGMVNPKKVSREASVGLVTLDED